MCWSVHMCTLTPHTCVLVACSLALPRGVSLETCLNHWCLRFLSPAVPAHWCLALRQRARQDCSLCACGIWLCPLEWQWRSLGPGAVV